MSDHKLKYWYECIDCGKEYDASVVRYLCPDCAAENKAAQPPKGVLKTLYHYDAIRAEGSFQKEILNGNYLPLLPIESYAHWPNLSIGDTPLYKVDPPGDKADFDLFLKDDSQNPSYSFKDRASALVAAFAKEHQIDTIVTASTGNAGSSISAICAMQKLRCIVLVPATAPKAKLTQICAYGAQLVPVDGKYDDAFDLSVRASEKYGWYNRNTAYNPLTIEGKKTVAFELYAQMKGQLPDRIFVPVGDGVIISGLYKGLEDLYRLGMILKIPVLVAVQSQKSDNLVNNLEEKETFRINPEGSIADSITVDIPRNFYMAKKFIRQYRGEAIAVSDEAILSASNQLSTEYGLFAEPAAAAAMAGLITYREQGKLEKKSTNLVLLTGSGLKDLEAVQETIDIPQALKPSIESLKALIYD